MSGSQYFLEFSGEFERQIKRLKKHDPTLVRKLDQQVAKILREPILGKPLRNVLRNCRRVHIGSFVLIYEIVGSVIRLLYFDHHDRIYKKF